MRLDELSDAAMDKAYRTLAAVFGDVKQGTPDGWRWSVKEATRGWTEAELQSAIKLASAECRYFPRAGDLTARRPGLTVASAPIDLDPDLCHQCGVKWYYAGFWCADGVVRPRIRCRCPQPSARWEHPDALAWREDDEAMVRDGFTRRAA